MLEGAEVGMEVDTTREREKPLRAVHEKELLMMRALVVSVTDNRVDDAAVENGVTGPQTVDEVLSSRSGAWMRS